MRRPLLGLAMLAIVGGSSSLGCSTQLPQAPPPPPSPIEPTVIVDNLPVAEPSEPPATATEPAADPSAAAADPAPPPAPRPGGSDPFRSDTVDDNKTGKQIMEKILTLPAADPPTPATPSP